MTTFSRNLNFCWLITKLFAYINMEQIYGWAFPLIVLELFQFLRSDENNGDNKTLIPVCFTPNNFFLFLFLLWFTKSQERLTSIHQKNSPSVIMDIQKSSRSILNSSKRSLKELFQEFFKENTRNVLMKTSSIHFKFTTYAFEQVKQTIFMLMSRHKTVHN